MDIRRSVAVQLRETRDALERLVRIPSVSDDGFDPAEVRRSAHATAEVLGDAGLETEILEIDGAHPAVLGSRPAPRGAPTVLLYAHHDVQPPGIDRIWLSPAFEPTERDGRLYGRGVGDDKGGIAMHYAAIRAWGDDLPVGVRVIVEGEEEIGSPHLEAFLSRYGDRLRADAAVLADSGNWRVGEPAITTSLRGIVDCIVEVAVLDHAVHSGQYGGAFPDALSVLVRTLASLHDDEGNVAVPGLATAEAEPLDLTEKELREQVGALEGVRMIGSGSITARLWRRPAVSVLAIDAPRIAEASNQLVPTARAKVSLRLAPGDDPDTAMEALADHLEHHAPWGAQIRVVRGAKGRPFEAESTGPVFEACRRAFETAFGRKPLEIGMGGTIPFVAAFGDAYPGTPLLLTGVDDPDSRPHGENESIDLADFERCCAAEALFLGEMASVLAT